MAVKTKKVLECDKCGTEEDVKTYDVRFPGQKRPLSFDLCREHSHPLEALRGARKAHGRPARGITPVDYGSVARRRNGNGG